MARRSTRTRSNEDLLEVTVLRAGGRPVRIEMEEGSTVEEAIDEAGYSVKDRDEVTVNGDTMDNLNDEVEHLDSIKIIPKFQGGN